METRIHTIYACSDVTANARHYWDFTMDCMHFKCTIKHICSSLVPKECYPYLVSVRNEQRVSKKCHVREHALRAIHTVHLWDFTMDCVHFRCTIKHLCSSLVPKECYPYFNWYLSEKNKESRALSAIHTVHSWDFTMDCVHFRCTIKHLCSSLVPKECYPYLVYVRNEQRVSKKCREP